MWETQTCAVHLVKAEVAVEVGVLSEQTLMVEVYYQSEPLVLQFFAKIEFFVCNWRDEFLIVLCVKQWYHSISNGNVDYLCILGCT